MVGYLVTGAAGFIASHLVKFLLKNTTSRVIGVDKLSYCSSLKHLSEVRDHPQFIFQALDLTDSKAVQELFERYRITTVLHLAAYTHVDHSFKEPLLFTHNNVFGTHVLLEQARRSKVDRFLHMSTDEVYGTAATVSDESSILDPTNPYSASKAAAEIMVRTYWHSYKMPVVIVRSNNVYGTHQYPEKVIPLFIQRLVANQPCVLHGSGKQTRSFLHVEDLCRGLLLLLEKGVLGEIYNIGSDNEIPIKELGERIIRLIKGKDADLDKWLKCGEDRCYNDLHYRINYDKIKALGFRSTIDFDTGLTQVIRWYLDNQDYWT